VKFYDTRERTLVDFQPQKQVVTLYVCGITPYDSAHLGHIFTFLIYDLIQRRLEDQGYTVKLVRNVTDVDEPIFRRAQENNESYTALAERETALFQETMRELNFRQPDAEPLASEYIAEMANAVKQLLDSEHAYRLGNDIYFDASTFLSFGSFSGYPEKLQLAFMADRGGDPERPGKRQPLDFLLWRGITDPHDAAAWDSPVGHGRPGWHIECSIMASRLLDTPIDLHGGGADLIFPHHECEVAQSESLGLKPYVRNWLHVAPLLQHGEKMSKSLGNLVFARDLLADGSSAAVRLALLRYHYRVGGQWRAIWWRDAKALAQRMHELPTEENGVRTGVLNAVRDALDNNLDTPAIYAALEAHVLAGGSGAELRPALELLGIAL
jgi:L-cysteine:1D-myo-inositol 2-amino-2-deoxy-alpha-D-glucopyranoside ligase